MKCLLLLVFSSLMGVTGFAQERGPGLKAESKGPFSYYRYPSDEVGAKDSPVAFQLTYDGALNTGYGELDLKVGDGKVRPIEQRLIKTLDHGFLPVFHYSFDQDGTHYEVETFATANGDPRIDLIAYMKVTLSNPGGNDRHAQLQVAYGSRGENARAPMPVRHWYQDQFMDASAFAKRDHPAGAGNAISVADHWLFSYSGQPSLDAAGLSATYDFNLHPGQSEAVYFCMPFVPLQSGHGAPAAAGADTYSVARNGVEVAWRTLLQRATDIQVPDPKVVNTLKAGLIYDLMARDVEADGAHFTQTVNKFQYHSFFPRDTSFIAHSYDLLNLHETNRETIEKYLVRDTDGKVAHLLRLHPDDWGQSLWAVGAHFRMTGDLAFAKEIESAIAPHLDEFEDRIKKDPLGLWTVAGPYDNELINGHYTSHNLWALLGLREAENIARAVGDKTQAERAHKLYDSFYKTFEDRLKVLTASDRGYIPPGMDDPLAGNDWENASGGVYPFRVFPPHHKWVTATVEMEREYKYREGIMTWGPNAYKGMVTAGQGKSFDPGYLHDYDTFQVDETLLARGDQQAVIEDLYSTLVHTSSTHAGFETSIKPWSDRDPGDNMPPHGWFAARYNELVRNMLVREDGDVLHLASALAPQWVASGQKVAVTRGATEFGPVDFAIFSRANGADVRIGAAWRTAPRQILFHIPWFLHATSALADGQRVAIKDGVIALPASTKVLNVDWTWREHPDLSYDRAVQIWLRKNYQPKAGEDTDHLFPTPTRPALVDDQTIFEDTYDIRLRSRSGKGIIRYAVDSPAGTQINVVYRDPIRISKTTRLEAYEIWPDGQRSQPLVVTIRKATYQPPIGVAASTPGLTFNYYEGDFNAMPDFGKLIAKNAGSVPTLDLALFKARPEQFALDIKGYINVPNDGVYTFTTGSDDGSKLWIGDELVVDNDGPHAYAEVSGQVALKKGLHTLRLTYFDAGGATFLKLFWAGPGLAKQMISAQAFSH